MRPGSPGRSTAFLLGQLRQDGFPAFFLIAIAVKTPLPLIALALIGFVVVMRGRGPPEDRFRALAPVIAAMAVVALVMPTRTNIGVRHVLAVFPLLAMLAAAGAITLWRARRGRTPARVAAVALLAWTLATPLAAAPDYFAWFNALAGRHPERVLSTAISTGGRICCACSVSSPSVAPTAYRSRTSARPTSAGTRCRR